MKKSFLKKLMLAFVAFGGIFVMASCQTTDHTASIPVEKCQVNVLTTADGTKKQAQVVIAVSNPTIYNTERIDFTYACFDKDGALLTTESDYYDIGIRHGASGYFAYTYTAENTPGSLTEKVTTVKITEAHIGKYQSVWQTYMPAFIVGIVLASMSVLFFAVELFHRGLTKDMLKDMFAEHMASEFTILGLVLIICLIPLIFSSWVTTVILLGSFAASIVVNGLLTLARIKTASN